LRTRLIGQARSRGRTRFAALNWFGSDRRQGKWHRYRLRYRNWKTRRPDNGVHTATAATGSLAYVRVGYECVGSWTGYQSDSYVATFHRITAAMPAADLPIATVWCVAGEAQTWPLMAYYPDDEWVEGWSVDIFSVKEIDAILVAEFCEAAGLRHKPAMIGEATPVTLGCSTVRFRVINGSAPILQCFAAIPKSRPGPTSIRSRTIVHRRLDSRGSLGVMLAWTKTRSC
jgi:hypothetical protein